MGSRGSHNIARVGCPEAHTFLSLINQTEADWEWVNAKEKRGCFMSLGVPGRWSEVPAFIPIIQVGWELMKSKCPTVWWIYGAINTHLVAVQVVWRMSSKFKHAIGGGSGNLNRRANLYLAWLILSGYLMLPGPWIRNWSKNSAASPFTGGRKLYVIENAV